MVNSRRRRHRSVDTRPSSITTRSSNDRRRPPNAMGYSSVTSQRVCYSPCRILRQARQAPEPSRRPLHRKKPSPQVQEAVAATPRRRPSTVDGPRPPVIVPLSRPCRADRPSAAASSCHRSIKGRHVVVLELLRLFRIAGLARRVEVTHQDTGVQLLFFFLLGALGVGHRGRISSRFCRAPLARAGSPWGVCWLPN